jgi:hypothetical protein
MVVAHNVESQMTDEETLLDLVPKDGSPAGNVTLLNALKKKGWDEKKYWQVRETLLEKRLLEKGKGKGGSVRRSSVDVREVVVATQTRSGHEGLLYTPLLKTLVAYWAPVMSIAPEHVHFEITARQGKKATGGKWSRPDITAVSVRSFTHLPGKYLDVWTFEVKSMEWLDVTAVFEAAAHASRATRSYALLQIPKNIDLATEEILDRCEREAARLRVGFITFVEATKFDTWETRVEAPRLDTAPEALEEFIGHLSDEAKRRLSQWKS